MELRTLIWTRVFSIWIRNGQFLPSSLEGSAPAQQHSQCFCNWGVKQSNLTSWDVHGMPNGTEKHGKRWFGGEKMKNRKKTLAKCIWISFWLWKLSRRTITTVRITTLPFGTVISYSKEHCVSLFSRSYIIIKGKRGKKQSWTWSMI